MRVIVVILGLALWAWMMWLNVKDARDHEALRVRVKIAEARADSLDAVAYEAQARASFWWVIAHAQDSVVFVIGDTAWTRKRSR